VILCRIQDRRPSKVSVEYRGNWYLVDLTAIARIDGADVGQPSTRLGDQEIVRRDRWDRENDWGWQGADVEDLGGLHAEGGVHS